MEMRTSVRKNACLVLFLVLSMLTACTALPATEAGLQKAAESFTLYQPVYLGKAENGCPRFLLKWKSFPGASDYQIAFFAEGEDPYGRGDFAIRSTENVYNSASRMVVFLQGVYTDTVTYRIKVKPDVRDSKNNQVYPGGLWSNIWEVRFTDGAYSVSETAADFDEELKAEEEKNADSKKENDERPEKTPLPHTFPEPLLLYLAREQGREEAFTADDIDSFLVNINAGGYGNPAQSFEEGAALAAFKKAVSQMTVEEEASDAVMITEGETFYAAFDRDGNRLFTFAVFQDHFLEGDRGALYPLSGAQDLDGIEGVMSTADWENYYADYHEKEDAYEVSENPEGSGVLEASYGTHLLAQAGAESVRDMEAYIDWNKEAGEFFTSDKEAVTAVFEALSGMTVGERVQNPSGQMWHMIIDYRVPGQNFNSTATLSFTGNCIEIDSRYYVPEGIGALYDSVDCELFRYLRDYSEAPKIDPQY
ncbi:MAG: hypothetical protein K6G83_02850 [Lachnospiraceae bacterium]|nr:hypothetical protein [Lachnospiraceae bacterium]